MDNLQKENQQRLYKEFNPVQVGFYSGIGTWITDVLLYPLDTITTTIRAHAAQHLTFQQGIEYIYKNYGMQGLYRGISSTIPVTAFPTMMYYYVYERFNQYSKEKLNSFDPNRKHTQKYQLMMPIISSSIAEISSLLFYMPFDTIRTRVQANDPTYISNYKGIIAGIKQVIHNEGFFRLYQASPLYVANLVIFSSLVMWFYELQRFYLLSLNLNKEGLDFKQSVIVGMTSSIVASILTNPIEVLITRFQIADSSKELLTVRKIFSNIYSKEGIKGFMKGLDANLIHRSSSSIICLPIYEFFQTRYGAQIDYE